MAADRPAAGQHTGAVTPRLRVSARLLMLVGDRLLLASDRGESWYYLPGGAVESGETVEAALGREIREETGLAASSLEFVGCVEDVRVEHGSAHHEINVIFAVALSHRTQVASREAEIDITSVSARDLHQFDLRPANLPALLARWLDARRPVWSGAATE
jgi:ADP-ribose pyrophosphatase YjhB (NUDIX family)